MCTSLISDTCARPGAKSKGGKESGRKKLSPLGKGKKAERSIDFDVELQGDNTEVLPAPSKC